jgi:DegV family protein with EDD domain
MNLKMTFKRIKFVTDSTSDIPHELAKEWGITVIPIFINIGGESYADDGEHFSREAYYDNLPTMNPLPTTSAPSPGLAEQMIRQAFEGADHLVIITLPQQLSATYDALRLGAAGLPQDRVTLIDSASLSMALGFQVLIGAEVAAATGDLNRVLAAIDRVRPARRLAAIINTLEFLRRSGRVNLATAGLGALLRVKPILTVEDGRVDTIARVRTMNRAKETLVQLLKEQGPLDRLALLHTNNLDELAEFRDELGDLLPEKTYMINATPAIGTHIGPKCLGFVSINQSWRD